MQSFDQKHQNLHEAFLLELQELLHKYGAEIVLQDMAGAGSWHSDDKIVIEFDHSEALGSIPDLFIGSFLTGDDQ